MRVPQVIPMEELKRPRVDVVVNCSGVFRDLFINQVPLSPFTPSSLLHTSLKFYMLQMLHFSHDVSRETHTHKFCSERLLTILWACSRLVFCVSHEAERNLCASVQMNLLDRAVKLAAEQDEPDEVNFVRKHAKEQVWTTLRA